MHAVRYTNRDLQMPPKYKLTENEIAVLEKWISLGAPDPREGKVVVTVSEINIDGSRDYWAFQKPRTSPGNPTIDHFIAEKLAAAHLKPAPSADRTTLIRRAYFDVIGLPPTPAQIDAFVEDTRPDKEAFAALVDELLASEGFGERWGRHWLDIVRYGESMGRTRNFPFPYAWRYRDYVIDAFNADKPYDVFVREQVAGDLLSSENDRQRDQQYVATGFLALGSMDLNENNREQYRMDVVDEQIDVTGRSVLALTTGCARCHDHKFDPIPQNDYYALAGIFRSTETFSGYGSKQGGNRASFRENLLVRLDSVPADVVAQEQPAFDPKVKKRLKNQERQLAQLNQQIRKATQGANVNARTKGKKNKNKKRRQDAEEIGIEKVEPEGPSIAELKQRQKELQRTVAATRRVLNKGTNNKKKAKKEDLIPRTANYAMGAREHA
jgi:cytochrome c553